MRALVKLVDKTMTESVAPTERSSKKPSDMHHTSKPSLLVIYYFEVSRNKDISATQSRQHESTLLPCVVFDKNKVE
jgi:hypothetical protein